jgi:hypothetical protein
MLPAQASEATVQQLPAVSAHAELVVGEDCGLRPPAAIFARGGAQTTHLWRVLCWFDHSVDRCCFLQLLRLAAAEDAGTSGESARIAFSVRGLDSSFADVSGAKRKL